MGVLKDSTGRDGTLVPASFAFEGGLPSWPSPVIPTTRTSEPVRPTQLKKIITATLLRREPCFKLRQGFGIVLHNPNHYMLWPPESSTYPHFDLYFSVQSRTLAYLSARGLYQKDHRIQSIDSSWVISRFFFSILSPSTCLVRRSCPDVGRVNPLSVF